MTEYCQIELTRGQVVRVSPEDFDELIKFKWHARWDKGAKKFYASRSYGNGKKMEMHRQICGNPQGLLVDHINRDTLDNRRENLRNATRSENGRNRGPNKNNTTGYKGVTTYKGKYVAAIMLFGKGHLIGRFKTPEEAHQAYVSACKELHGDFAYVA